MATTGDEGLTVVDANVEVPEVDAPDPVQLKIGERFWRAEAPKLESWVPVFRAVQQGQWEWLLFEVDDFLIGALGQRQFNELRQHVQNTPGLDREHIANAAYQLADHFAPWLEPRGRSLGLVMAGELGELSSDDAQDARDEEGDEDETAPTSPPPAPKTPAKKTPAKKTPAKKAATKKTAAKKTSRR